MKHSIIITIILFSALRSLAQQIENGIELRPRAILDNGYVTPKTTENTAIGYIMQRSRLFASYTNHKIETYLSIQDVRFWGSNITNNTSNKTTNGINLAQGWCKLHLTKTLSLKLGRQIFSYDDERVLAARNWRDNQAANDALMISYKNMQHKIDLNLSWNTENTNSLIYSISNYRMFNFVHYQFNKENITLSSMNILSAKNINDSSTTMHKKVTHGVFGKYKNDIISCQTSAYHQYSIDNNATKDKAYCLTSNIWAKASSRIKMGVGFNYISGHNLTKHNSTYVNTNHTFDLLQGKRHGYYGYIDYFSKTPKQGLQDYIISLNIIPLKKITIQADYHIFFLAQNYINQNSAGTVSMDKFLGSEFDLTLKWKIMKEATLQGGYSCYFTSTTLKTLKNVQGSAIKFPQFAYLMLTIKPQWSFDLNKTSKQSN